MLISLSIIGVTGLITRGADSQPNGSNSAPGIAESGLGSSMLLLKILIVFNIKYKWWNTVLLNK